MAIIKFGQEGYNHVDESRQNLQRSEIVHIEKFVKSNENRSKIDFDTFNQASAIYHYICYHQQSFGGELAQKMAELKQGIYKILLKEIDDKRKTRRIHFNAGAQSDGRTSISTGVNWQGDNSGFNIGLNIDSAKALRDSPLRNVVVGWENNNVAISGGLNYFSIVSKNYNSGLNLLKGKPSISVGQLLRINPVAGRITIDPMSALIKLGLAVATHADLEKRKREKLKEIDSLLAGFNEISKNISAEEFSSKVDELYSTVISYSFIPSVAGLKAVFGSGIVTYDISDLAFKNKHLLNLEFAEKPKEVEIHIGHGQKRKITVENDIQAEFLKAYGVRILTFVLNDHKLNSLLVAKFLKTNSDIKEMLTNYNKCIAEILGINPSEAGEILKFDEHKKRFYLDVSNLIEKYEKREISPEVIYKFIQYFPVIEGEMLVREMLAQDRNTGNKNTLASFSTEDKHQIENTVKKVYNWINIKNGLEELGLNQTVLNGVKINKDGIDLSKLGPKQKETLTKILEMVGYQVTPDELPGPNVFQAVVYLKGIRRLLDEKGITSKTELKDFLSIKKTLDLTIRVLEGIIKTNPKNLIGLAPNQPTQNGEQLLSMMNRIYALTKYRMTNQINVMPGDITEQRTLQLANLTPHADKTREPQKKQNIGT